MYLTNHPLLKPYPALPDYVIQAGLKEESGEMFVLLTFFEFQTGVELFLTSADRNLPNGFIQARFHSK